MPGSTAVAAAARRELTLEQFRSVEAFVFREARLQDEHRYEDWEALWAEDGCYWVPAGGTDIDPASQVSFIYDNRVRIASRIKQLKTGGRHSQKPPSRLNRVVSNVEACAEQDLIHVSAAFLLTEARHGTVNLWSGRTQYILRSAADNGFQMVLKKVLLVDNHLPVPTLAFLI